MAHPNTISLLYYGRDADENRLDLYDASQSYYGLARTLAVLGHYYLTKEIIVKAPQSAMPLFIIPPEAGSFKQTIKVGIISTVSAVVAVPFTVFSTRVIESWIPPSPNAEMVQVVQLLKEQNELLRKQMGLTTGEKNLDQKKVEQQSRTLEKCMQDNRQDLQVLRSVTSQSFKNIYRPIGRSADQIGIIGGLDGTPKGIVDYDVLQKIEADDVDATGVTLMAVVNSFSRGSKTGIVFSRDFMTSFRIEYPVSGRLPREDDFSWSQYSGNPIRMTGRFVRFFDRSIKKLLVHHVERVEHRPDVEDYFRADREVRIP